MFASTDPGRPSSVSSAPVSAAMIPVSEELRGLPRKKTLRAVPGSIRGGCKTLERKMTSVTASRLGHTLRSATGRSAQQNVGALRREDAQNGIDDGRFANPGATGHDQHLGRQCEPDRGGLAFGKRKTDTPLDPRQGLIRIDPGPRQRAICQPHQPLGQRYQFFCRQAAIASITRLMASVAKRAE
jgi:hypothetical protein